MEGNNGILLDECISKFKIDNDLDLNKDQMF